MGFFIGFVLIFLVIITVILLLPIRLYISYIKDENNSVSSIDLKYAFFKYRIYPDGKPKKTKEKAEKPESSFEEKKTKIDEYIRIFNGIKNDVVKILDYASARAIIFEKIGIDVEFGFEDAMHTGIFTGVLNGFVYSILGVIHQRALLEDMNVNIQPVFGNICFKTQIHCILRIRNVHIIIVAVNVLKLLRKMKKIKGGR